MPGSNGRVAGALAWRRLVRRLAPIVGAVACSAGCAGVPVVVASLSAAGIGFLRTDWLLIPLDGLSIAFALRGFMGTRLGRSTMGPLLVATGGGLALLLSLRLTGSAAECWLAVGTVALAGTTIWDTRRHPGEQSAPTQTVKRKT
jgi:hypothetical protein